MITKKTWKEFSDAGMLWWINMILHTFGWAIVIEVDQETEEAINAYPARVKFRGFNEESNTKGYINVSKFLKENVDDLVKESEE